MSIAIAHFALGAGSMTLIVAFLLPTVPYPRTVCLLSGVWALVPDGHRVVPIFEDQLAVIHQHPEWIDLFWFHRTLDELDPTDSNAVGAVFLLFFLTTTLLADRYDYQAPGPVRQLYEYFGIDTGLNKQDNI